MFSTIRHQVKLTAIAAGLAFATAFGLSDALAQSFVVKDFSCTTDPFGVHVDISGLGHTNLCIEGSVTLNLDCACVGGGGNCPTDAKKQILTDSSQAGLSVEPKNGRVTTTFTLPVSFSDGLCTEPQCGSGQETKLIAWNTSPPTGSPATFRVCETSVAAGGSCSCAGQPILATRTCGPTSDIVFEGKHDSCIDLFQ